MRPSNYTWLSSGTYFTKSSWTILTSFYKSNEKLINEKRERGRDGEREEVEIGKGEGKRERRERRKEREEGREREGREGGRKGREEKGRG